MSHINWLETLNALITGLIGFAFGGLLTWLNYRLVIDGVRRDPQKYVELAQDWESHNLKVHVSIALEYSTRLLHEV